MAKLFNRVRMNVSGTPGTGTVTLGTVYSNAFCTFAEAGVANADVVAYLIEDGSDFEMGIGTYTSSGTTLSRDTVRLSKIGGTAGTTKLTLTSAAQVRITAAKEDIANLNQAQTFVGNQTVTGALDVSSSVTGASVAGNMVAAQSDQETATSTTTLVSPGRQQYHPSAVKAWGSISMAAAINASYNVSSVTDVGTGQFQPNYTTAFSSANYALTPGLTISSASGQITAFNSKVAGSVLIFTMTNAGSVSETGITAVDFTAAGDQ